MLTPFMSMHGTLISSLPVIGIAEYIDLAVANVKYSPLAVSAFITSAVCSVISGAGLSRVPSRSETYSVFFINKPPLDVDSHINYITFEYKMKAHIYLHSDIR